jgi:hypothetical protein
LVDAVETELSTDFAILNAVQDGVYYPGSPASFAASGPGLIVLEAGNKYSRISIRAERWDSRPPPSDEWEDVDDIPFEEVPSAGKLVLSGFDLGEAGLDVSGLGRGRVQVLARGRHRYDYTSDADVDGIDPEEWLLRLYPLDGPVDPMAGGPRRIAGGGGLAPLSAPPWLAAVLGFRTSGWTTALVSSHGFYLANLALLTSTAPLTRLELASRMAQRMPPWELGGPDATSLEVPPRPSHRDNLDPLAQASNRARIETIGDAIDALLSIGLLLVEERDGDRLLVPNPSPKAAWESLGLSGVSLAWARTQALEADHRNIASNIGYAIAWCGEDGLSGTPRAMAIRWCTSIDDVLGGLRLLGGSGRAVSDRELGFDVEIDPDEALTLRKGDPPIALR